MVFEPQWKTGMYSSHLGVKNGKGMPENPHWLWPVSDLRPLATEGSVLPLDHRFSVIQS